MRMWMVDPKVLCQQHLLGEHVELHMTVGCLTKGYERTAYALAQMDLLELDAIERRHIELVEEMERRGMNHQSPLTQPEFDTARYWGTVHVRTSYAELRRRCEQCAARMDEMNETGAAA